MIIRPHRTKLHRAVGDCAMVIGGAMVSGGLAIDPWVVCVTVVASGIFMIGMGVYVREFTHYPEVIGEEARLAWHKSLRYIQLEPGRPGRMSQADWQVSPGPCR